MADEQRMLLQKAIDSPKETLIIYFMDKQSMESKRTRLLRLRRTVRDMPGIENVRIKSESLDTATKEGYTHRILVQYIEASPERIIAVHEDGTVRNYEPQEEQYSVLPKAPEAGRTNALELKVERLVMELNIGTEEEILQHFESFTYKPSKELMQKYLYMREKAMNRLQKGTREKIRSDFKAMQESNISREEALKVYPDASKDLIDEYFPEA